MNDEIKKALNELRNDIFVKSLNYSHKLRVRKGKKTNGKVIQPV